MTENRKTEKLTHEEETRSAKIARIVSQLPEREQEKIYYMLKGVELAGSAKTGSPRAAAL